MERRTGPALYVFSLLGLYRVLCTVSDTVHSFRNQKETSWHILNIPVNIEVLANLRNWPTTPTNSLIIVWRSNWFLTLDTLQEFRTKYSVSLMVKIQERLKKQNFCSHVGRKTRQFIFFSSNGRQKFNRAENNCMIEKLHKMTLFMDT
jgi:hypothetical protein